MAWPLAFRTRVVVGQKASLSYTSSASSQCWALLLSLFRIFELNETLGGSWLPSQIVPHPRSPGPGRAFLGLAEDRPSAQVHFLSVTFEVKPPGIRGLYSPSLFQLF